MRPAATRLNPERASLTLYVAFELGNREWRLACTPGLDQLPLVRTIGARDVAALEAELARAKAHFGLPAPAAVRGVPLADGSRIRDAGARGSLERFVRPAGSHAEVLG